jgi:hypothetical protein
LYSSPPSGTTPTDRTCFAFLVSVFERNKKTFLFKITIQGVSLWHFHVCMYYNPNWFIPSIFLPFSPLLMVISTVLKIIYSLLYKKYMNHIHLLNFPLTLPLSLMTSP